MKQNEFVILCNKYLIDPSLALEDENLCDLLKNKASNSEIEEHLKNNF